MTELAVLFEVMQIAHETLMPHHQSAGGGGGGASPILIVAGLVVTLGVVAGLVWVKKRVDAEADPGIPKETIDGRGG